MLPDRYCLCCQFFPDGSAGLRTDTGFQQFYIFLFFKGTVIYQFFYKIHFIYLLSDNSLYTYQYTSFFR